MPRLSLIRVRFSRQASDGNYGSETVACELEMTADDGETLDEQLAHGLTAQARHIVHAELEHSPSYAVRRTVEEPKPLSAVPSDQDVDEATFYVAGALKFAAGLVVGLAIGTGIVITHADQVDAEVAEAAAVAGVNPTDLQGAVNTTGEDPFLYLRGTGELPPVSLAPPCTPPPKVAPPPAPTSTRVACLEHAESQDRNVANAHGSGAVGILQYMVPTFQSHAREMGHTDWSPWIPWQAEAVAEHDLAMGRRAQWTVSGC